MINVSPAFLEEMYQNDNRKFTYSVDVSFADGTTDTLTDLELYNGGVSIEESVSEDEKLEIGNCTINKATIVLQNFDEEWNEYDFTDAQMVVYIGLDINGTVERFQKGVFTVTEQDYNGALLTLTALDRMSQFEVDFKANSTLTYPTTFAQMVEEACTKCGVTLATPDFPNQHFPIDVFPIAQGMTFRTVLSWVSMCCGCNAKVNRFGELEIGYYDFDFLNFAWGEMKEDWTNTVYLLTEDGDNIVTEDSDKIILDNGILNVFPSLYSIKAAPNDTTITGVQVLVENSDADTAEDAILTYSYGTDGYAIILENNYLLNKNNAQAIADFVGQRLVGKTYRKASYSHLSDPLVEAGDVAAIYDGKGRMYKVLVSSMTFTANDRQSSVSAGENPPRIVTSTPVNNSVGAATPMVTTGVNAQRYSQSTENFIRTIRSVETRGGLYTDKVPTTGGGYVYVLHDKPSLDASDIQIEISTDGVMVTANGTAPDPDWYGLKVDGNMIVNILQATGINADWINAGTINGVDIFTVPSDSIYEGVNGNYYAYFVFSEEGLRLGLKPTPDNLNPRYMLSPTPLIEPYMMAEGVMSPDFPSEAIDYPIAKLNTAVLNYQQYYVDYSGELQYINLDDVTKDSEYDNASLSKPSSLTNFSFGTTWNASARRLGNTVMVSYNFNGYFTATSSTGGTLFTLPVGFRPIVTSLYYTKINQSGVRYLLTINSSGAVTLQNVQGAAGSSNQWFRDTITFVR